MIKKVLIANRGEIALRIHRACHEMGIKTVAVHSTVDANSMYVRLADESVCIGPGCAKNSYLDIQAILSAATISGADAIHPGYGFLSENAIFAAMVEEHGFIFIGPSPEHIELMGNKNNAKQKMIEIGIPVVPGSNENISNLADIEKICNEIQYPILIKASSGGGGKGMQIVDNPAQLPEAISIAQSEAKANFGNKSVFIEKYLQNPRHIEIQVLADNHGNVIHLGERDCSIQRRHQKIWEEAPSPAISVKQRNELGMLAVKACKAIGYRGVGTFEFLYENNKFYFIEMNTRIQVEHPTTEMITGVDLIQAQIRVAIGKVLGIKQDDVKIKGHAIECRINAENPNTFLPCPGKVKAYHTPGGPGVRIDSALYAGYEIPNNYDSLVAKLIVLGSDRRECLRRLKRSLEEYIIDGVDTTIPLHQELVENVDIVKGQYNTHWLETHLKKER